MLHALTFAAYTITLDGRVVLSRARAAVVGGHVFLPVRTLGETIGADIGWDGATRSITVQRGTTVSVIPARERVRIVSGRAYAPLRTVANAFGMFVSYDAPSRTVALERRQQPIARVPAASPTVAIVTTRTLPFTVSENPPNGAQIHEAYPTISVRFAGAPAIDGRFLHFELDGRDVTPYASIVGDQVLYTPRNALSPGQHHVAVSAYDSSGTPIQHDWSFGDTFAFAPPVAPSPLPIGAIYLDRWVGAGTNAFDVIVEGAPGITGYVWIEGVSAKYFPLTVYGASSYVAHVYVPNGVNQPFAHVAARLTLPNGITEMIVMPQTITLVTPPATVRTYAPYPTPTPRVWRRPLDATPTPTASPRPTLTPTPRPTASPTPSATPAPERTRRPLLRRSPGPEPDPSALPKVG